MRLQKLTEAVSQKFFSTRQKDSLYYLDTENHGSILRKEVQMGPSIMIRVTCHLMIPRPNRFSRTKHRQMRGRVLCQLSATVTKY